MQNPTAPSTGGNGASAYRGQVSTKYQRHSRMDCPTVKRCSRRGASSDPRIEPTPPTAKIRPITTPEPCCCWPRTKIITTWPEIANALAPTSKYIVETKGYHT